MMITCIFPLLGVFWHHFKLISETAMPGCRKNIHVDLQSTESEVDY